MAQLRPDPAAAPAVLTKATLRAARHLGLSQQDLGEIVGLSGATISRMARGRGELGPAEKEGELALLLLRVHRSLDALLGGDGEKVRRWLEAESFHLGGTPREMLSTVTGLVRVAEYLDAMRGK
jgi:transcriptional regulator with XRE-family HTH domain